METCNYLRRYTELPFLVDYLVSQELYLPSPKTWDDRNDSYYLEQFAALEGVKDTFALCLTGASETYHHWKVFSSGSSGVCIDFRKDKFVEECRKIPGLRAEFVDYKKLDDLKKAKPRKDQLPYLKRYPFRDENEFRLFVAPEKANPSGFRVPIPLNAINYIHLSPWLPDNVANEVKRILKSIRGCSKIRMFKSTLIENQRWKKYGANGT